MLGWFSRHALTLNLCLAAAVPSCSWRWVWLSRLPTTSRPPPRPRRAPAASRPHSADAEAPAATTWQDAVKMFAAAVAISLTAFATAITQCRIGSAGVGVLAENPKLFGNILVFLVVPETMVILGFVVAALMLF